MVVEDDRLPGFDQVVELVGGPARELFDDAPGSRPPEEMEAVEQPRERVHQLDVGLEALADSGSLDLDGDRLAGMEDRAMDLADRRGSERGGFEGPEDLLRRAAEFARDDLADLRVRVGSDLVQEPEQLVAVRRRQQVEAHCEHLAELDPGAAELVQREPHPDRAAGGRAVLGLHPVDAERRQHPVSQEHDQDLPHPTRVSDQRSHRSVTESTS